MRVFRIALAIIISVVISVFIVGGYIQIFDWTPWRVREYAELLWIIGIVLSIAISYCWLRLLKVITPPEPKKSDKTVGSILSQKSLLNKARGDSDSTKNYKQLIIEGNEAKCPTCGHTVVKNKSGDYDSFCGKCGEDFVQTPITKEVETSITKTEALKKLHEAKEHLELELITQDDYDKLKNELSPIIMSSSDEKSETTQPEDTPTNQKTIPATIIIKGK